VFKLSSNKIAFLVELLVVFLAGFGFIPKEAVLFLTGFLIFYLLCAPLKESFLLFLASIPLFVALPLNASFDHMANWRLLAVALFFSFLLEKGVWRISFWREKLKRGFGSLGARLKKPTLFEILLLLFLLILAFSLLSAQSLGLGLKKIAFLVNLFLIYPIVKSLLAQNADYLKRILKASLVALGTIILFALLQLVLVFFLPLHTFWQFWASGFIDVFYGSALSELLQKSNTWFAYFQNQPPTLRLFSVFPDSHSFALFLVLSLPALIGAGFLLKKKSLKAGISVLAFLSFLGIALSGSRGAWLSSLAALGAILAALWLKGRPVNEAVKVNLKVLALFAAAFLASWLYPSLLYMAQDYQETGRAEFKRSMAFFERAKSISDASEISNRGRLEIWDSSLKTIAQKPLSGVGAGNFVAVLGEDPANAKKGASAHNLYLDFGSEAGVLAMVVLAFIFVEILKMSWHLFDKKKGFLAVFFLALTVYTAWVLGYSLFDVVLLNDKVFLLFTVWLAVINHFYARLTIPPYEN